MQFGKNFQFNSDGTLRGVMPEPMAATSRTSGRLGRMNALVADGGMFPEFNIPELNRDYLPEDEFSTRGSLQRPVEPIFRDKRTYEECQAGSASQDPYVLNIVDPCQHLPRSTKDMFPEFRVPEQSGGGMDPVISAGAALLGQVIGQIIGGRK